MNIYEREILKYQKHQFIKQNECIAVEEPLEIFINDEPYFTVVRLPDDDFSLALGKCFTDGIIHSMKDILDIDYCDHFKRKRVVIKLDPSLDFKIKHKNHISFSSSGMSGKELIAEMYKDVKTKDQTLIIKPDELFEFQKKLENNQEIYKKTGTAHAALILDNHGNMLSFAEDVGRHNALDKAIGILLLKHTIQTAKIVILSSRLSFEMVQKAGLLDVELIAGFSSATSMAVDLAEKINISLIGFLRKNSFNIYTGDMRISNEK
jgi:FdhD protein